MLVFLFYLGCLVAGAVAGWVVYDCLHPVEHSAIVRASEVQRVREKLEKEAGS
jgi:hypothetical protein